jgi:hypothetical protein
VKNLSKRNLILVGMATLLIENFACASVEYTIGNGMLETFNLQITGPSGTIFYNNALAGGISITQPATPAANGDMPLSYITVCTDIEGTLYLGQTYTYNTPVTPFSGQSGLAPTWGDNPADSAMAIQNAAYLFNTYYAALTGSGIGGVYADQSLATQRAALQLAVWAALYNTTASGAVNGSRFAVTSGDPSAISDAESWLSGLTGNYDLNGYLLTPTDLADAPNNGNADGEPPQELLIREGDFTPSPFDSLEPVPEPPTMIAGALLLLPFGVSVLRILRRRRA